MPKKDGIRLVKDFLLRNLDENTFGEDLQWLDAKSGKFGMTWLHKSNGSWSRKKHGAVCEAWARCKNLWDSNDPKAISKAKQRFRSALRKLPNIKSLERSGNYRTYVIDNISELRQQQYKTTQSPPYDSGYESGSSAASLELLVTNISKDIISPEQYIPEWAKEEVISPNYLENLNLPPLPFIEFDTTPGYY